MGNYRSRISILLCISAIIFSCGKPSRQSLVKKIKPSVVTIITFGLSKSRQRSYPSQPSWLQYTYDTLSQGSGFLINSNGHIVTNYHVLQHADSAIIKTFDNKIYKITSVVAHDKKADLIIVATNMPRDSVQFLDLSTEYPSEGEEVIAIGSPLGLEQTVSDGIVSAVRESADFGRLIQITAPISPGSSGGPVVDMDGNLIGVTSFQIVSGQNLNFAIPGEKISSLIPLPQITDLCLWNFESRRREIFVNSAFSEIGYAYEMKCRWSSALYFLSEAQQRGVRNPELYSSMGRCHWFLEQDDEAIVNFKKALQLDSNNALYFDWLSNVYLRTGSFQEALAASKKAVNLDPTEWLYRSNLSDAYLMLGRHSDAIAQFKRKIELYVQMNQKTLPDFAVRKIDGFYLCQSEDHSRNAAFNLIFFADYAYLGELHCLAGDTISALRIYKFLRKYATTDANKWVQILHEKIYPSSQDNK